MNNPFASIGVTKNTPSVGSGSKNRFELIGTAPSNIVTPDIIPAVKPVIQTPKKNVFQKIGSGVGNLLDHIESGAETAVRDTKNFFGITKPMAFPIGEGITPEQAKKAQEYVTSKPDTGEPLKIRIGDAMNLQALYVLQEQAKKRGELPKTNITPETFKAAQEALETPVMGVVGGPDLVAKQLGGRVSKATLQQLAKETDPVKISNALQKVYDVPQDIADEASIPLSKARTVQEIKDVLLNTRPPEGPIATGNTPVGQKALPKPGQIIDETLTPQQILQKAEADSAHLGITKSGSNVSVNRFASIGKTIPESTPKLPLTSPTIAVTPTVTSPGNIPNLFQNIGAPAQAVEPTFVPPASSTTSVSVSSEPLAGIKNDIPNETARNAHRGTSFDPEKRAVQRIDDYTETLTKTYEELKKLATTPEKLTKLNEEFLRYREGYKARTLALLNAESRTISPMISGAGNFPVARNRKRLDVVQNRYTDLTEFHEKAVKRMKNELNPTGFKGTSEKTITDMGTKLEELKALQERMKKANAIIRSATQPQAINGLQELGFSRKEIVDLIAGDYMGRKGFPTFSITSINNKIKTLQQRITETAGKREAANTTGNKEEQVGDVRIVQNFDENRIQIHFNGKPSDEMRASLRKKGFRWSPTNNAWQRILTPQAIKDAREIVGAKTMEPVDSKQKVSTSEIPTNSKQDTAQVDIPKTIRVWRKSRFSEGGGYMDVPVIRIEENITLYQGGNGEKRQFWTPNKKYAEQFGNVTEKTGTFYKVDNGNRVTDVYVEKPAPQKEVPEPQKTTVIFRGKTEKPQAGMIGSDLGSGIYYAEKLSTAQKYGDIIEQKDVVGLNIKHMDEPDYNKLVQIEYMKIRDSHPEWDGTLKSATKIRHEAKDVVNTELFIQGYDGVAIVIGDDKIYNVFPRDFYEKRISSNLEPAPDPVKTVTAEAPKEPPLISPRKEVATSEQLQRMIKREEESLASARANPAAHVKAYGEDRIPKYTARIAELKARLERIAPAKPKVPALIPKKVMVPKSSVPLPENLSMEGVRIAQKMEFLRDELKDHPGKKMLSLINKKEGEILDDKDIMYLKETDPARFDRLWKIRIKRQQIAESAFAGTPQSREYDNKDVQRQALDDYRNKRKELKQLHQDQKELDAKITEYVDSQKDEIALAKLSEKAGNINDLYVLRRERATKKLAIIREVEKMLRSEGRNRAQKVSAIADFFKLTDKEMKEVLHGTPNYNVMTEPEFQNFLKGIEGKAYTVAERTIARVSLEGTIASKELKKVENLREALKLKKFENMKTEELRAFEEALAPFERGDEFLGKRQLETVKNTDLSGIHTKREALEVLSKKTGIPVSELDVIAINKKEKWVNRALYDAALARRNPFYRNMVEEFSRAEVEGSIRFHDFKTKLNDLIITARKSRSRGFLDRAIPTDKLIFEWLSAGDDGKILVEKAMTKPEIEAAKFIRDAYAEARNYLVEQGVLKRYRSNYITHTRRSFLEAWREGTKESGAWSGIKAAFTEILDSVKQDSAYFNILDQSTKDVLPLEKFFQYSLTRGDELIPSKNVARAVGNYFRAFEKKRMLDSIIPKIDIYAHVLTPSKMTPRGLEYDGSLKKFVKEWLNTKKGRATTIVVPTGTTMDAFMRGGVALTRILDLALNIPVGIASHIGEQVMTFGTVGTKNYATGVRRFYTAQGKKIAQKYVGLVGETLADKLTDASKNLTEKAASVFYGLFSSASRKANIIHILGSISKEEFQTGIINSEHLAQIRNAMNKWRSIEGDTSILGKTPEGAIFTQYKSWAVPILHGTIDNLNRVVKLMKAGKNPVKDEEVQELLRITLTTAAILLTTYGFYDSLKNKKDRTFLENLAFKSANDGLSLFGGLNPALWLTVPRFPSFLKDLSLSLQNVVASLATGDRTKEGDIEGLKKLGNTVVPSAIKQILPDSAEEKAKTQMESTYDEVQQLVAEDREDEARAIVDAMTDAEYEEYKKVKASAKRADTLQKKEAMLETVKEVRKLQKKGKETEAHAIVDALSEADYKIYQSASKMIPLDGSKPEFTPNEAVTEKGLIHSVTTYAEAIGSDPVTAFNRIFTGQKIRRVDNGAIIVERMSLEDSRAESKKQAGKNDTSGFRLDHTVPLELGGSNGDSNLKLVPESVWASYTPTENVLGQALRADKITRKEAQDLIRRFKNGELTAEEVKDSI